MGLMIVTPEEALTSTHAIVVFFSRENAYLSDQDFRVKKLKKNTVYKNRFLQNIICSVNIN